MADLDLESQEDLETAGGDPAAAPSEPAPGGETESPAEPEASPEAPQAPETPDEPDADPVESKVPSEEAYVQHLKELYADELLSHPSRLPVGHRPAPAGPDVYAPLEEGKA